MKRIWFAADQVCSKKLKAAIPLWLPFYAASYKTLSEQTQAQLLSISAATIDRVLKPVRVAYSRKGLSGTRPGTLLKNQIPIRTGFWDVSQPGFMEADTVAHCGNSLAGNFVWSLTMTDILTTWTENRATWNKGSAGVLKQIKSVEANLPFDLQGFDCDNGSEFLNWHLLRYFTDQPSVTSFTRSRPYKKYDFPRTPYDRVMASDFVSEKTKENLKTIHEALNPFILKNTIEKKLRVIFKKV